jgi:hypothetical protein
VKEGMVKQLLQQEQKQQKERKTGEIKRVY